MSGSGLIDEPIKISVWDSPKTLAKWGQDLSGGLRSRGLIQFKPVLDDLPGIVFGSHAEVFGGGLEPGELSFAEADHLQSRGYRGHVDNIARVCGCVTEKLMFLMSYARAMMPRRGG